MVVQMKFFSIFKEITGKSQIIMDRPPRDVRSLLQKLVDKFGPKLADQLFLPETGELRDSVIILVNGHSIKMLDGLDTTLESGDEVIGDSIAILQPVGGG